MILPPSALDHLARLNIQYPMLFEVSNTTTSRRSHCGVMEFIAEEGTCYLPYWMMQNLLLQEGSLLRITNTSLPKGTFVKLQPVSSDFLDIHNPRAVLENSLRNYATLTVGDCIVIDYNQKKFEIEIIECKPAAAISIIEADVNVDFAPPKDYKEPERQPRSGAPANASNLKVVDEPEEPEPVVEDKLRVFGGQGQRVDGKAIKTPQGTPALGPSAAPPDPFEDMPWKAKIPGGIKYTEKPYGFGAGHMTGAQTADAGKRVDKENLFGGGGQNLQ